MKYLRITLVILLLASITGCLTHPESDTVQHSVRIAQPAGTVFMYVTNPGFWPAWHPSSVGVSAGADHSLDIGESVTEAFKVAGREGEVVWTVTEKVPDQKWAISGDIVDGNGTGGYITYELREEGAETVFTRTFTYRILNFWHYLLNEIFVHKKIEQESQAAVDALKAVLEEGKAPILELGTNSD
ncbi:MAG: SRPBCC family protein [Bacteroidota bacterium]